MIVYLYHIMQTKFSTFGTKTILFISQNEPRQYTVYGKTFDGENFRSWNRKGLFMGKHLR